jgi:hypothetical protein
VKVGDTVYHVRPIAEVGSDDEKTARAIERFREGTLT